MSLISFNITLNIEKSQRYGRARARSEPDTMCYTPRRIITLLLDIEMMRRVQRGAQRSGASSRNIFQLNIRFDRLTLL